MFRKIHKKSQFTLLENTLVVDTRDCVGTQSLTNARAYYVAAGGRAAANGTIVTTTGIGTNPVVVTFNSVSELKDGDTVIINGVRGNTNVNGVHVISSVNTVANTAVIFCWSKRKLYRRRKMESST